MDLDHETIKPFQSGRIFGTDRCVSGTKSATCRQGPRPVSQCWRNRKIGIVVSPQRWGKGGSAYADAIDVTTPILRGNKLVATILRPRNTLVSTASSVWRKRSFSPVVYVRVITYKSNDMRSNQWGTRFFPDGQPLGALYAPNVGSHRCLLLAHNVSSLAEIVGSRLLLFARIAG
jgi:hypothetical protein